MRQSDKPFLCLRRRQRRGSIIEELLFAFQPAQQRQLLPVSPPVCLADSVAFVLWDLSELPTGETLIPMSHTEDRRSWYWSFVSRPSPDTSVSALQVYLRRREAIRSDGPEPFPDAVVAGLDSDEEEWHSRPIASVYLAGERNIHEEDATPVRNDRSSHSLFQQRPVLPAPFPTSPTSSATPPRRFSSPLFSSSHQSKQPVLPTHTSRREEADDLFGSRRSSLPTDKARLLSSAPSRAALSTNDFSHSTSSPLTLQEEDGNVRWLGIPNLGAFSSDFEVPRRRNDRSGSPIGLAGFPSIATPVEYPQLPEPEEDPRQAFINNVNRRQQMPHSIIDIPGSTETANQRRNVDIADPVSTSDSGYCGSDSLSEAARQGEQQSLPEVEKDELSPADELFQAFGDTMRGVAGAFGFGGPDKNGG